MIVIRVVGSLYGLFQIDSIRDKQHWGKKKKKQKHFKICETTVAGAAVSEWPWSGTEAGTAAVQLKTINFSANSNNFFVLHKINEKKKKKSARRVNRFLPT